MSGPGADRPSDDHRESADQGARAGTTDDQPRARTGTTDDQPRARPGTTDEGRTPRPGRTGARSPNDVTIEDDGVVRWFLRTDDGRVVAVRDVFVSVAIVAVVGLVLFGISGAWPPLVAIESGSMEPNMHRGDLVFVVDDDRFVGDGAIVGTGVVPYDVGDGGGHEKFGKPGDVIIFKPDGSEARTPVIHRAHFWVEEGENWVDTKANPDYVGGATCEGIATCPATHDGFITKGDANGGYDQAVGGANTDVVKPEWVTGKGMLRVPWLGHVRLVFDGLLFSAPTIGLVAIAGAAAFAGGRRPGSR